MVIRRNVWRLGAPWADDVLWYARGVRALAQRALAELTSWRFYAGIHGFDAARWTELGHLSSADQPPRPADVATFWFQCQHGSWYFLPWHRGYLAAFEANVRRAIADLGGPGESWALPYWNYLADGEAGLPAEFASPSWPDGEDDNPLFVVARYGPDGDGHVFVPVGEVDVDALADPDFTGVPSGGGPGFGGVDTGFSHTGQVHGGIETQPHDYVHGLIGGAEGNVGRNGAMADPRTAALDPIFWLHHANIDRLWQSWRRLDPVHADPVDPVWLGGPAQVGQRPFCMPMPDGSTWTYTPRDVISTAALGYEYDDLDPVGRTVGMVAAAESAGSAGGGDAVAPGPDRRVEMVGASEPGVPLRAAPTEAVVALDGEQLRQAGRAIGAMTESVESTPPERVLLNLENVRGTADATTFSVYVGLPAGAEPGDHPELLAGSIGLFGLSQASDPQGEGAGEGITYVLDITRVVRDARLDEAAATGRLPVTLVPVRSGAVDPDVTIGRVSVFRQRG